MSALERVNEHFEREHYRMEMIRYRKLYRAMVVSYYGTAALLLFTLWCVA